MAEVHRVDSAIDCLYDAATPGDGAYSCFLHYSAGFVRRQEFKMGSVDPLGTSPDNKTLSAIITELHGRLPQEQAVAYLRDKEIPRTSFIGLTIVRECLRAGHGNEVSNTQVEAVPDTPRSERVASFVFARQDAEIVDLEPFQRRNLYNVTAAGVGKVRRLGYKKAEFPVVHMPLSDIEYELPIIADQAIAALPAPKNGMGPYVLLHSYPQIPEYQAAGVSRVYVEQRVGPEIVLGKAA